MHGVKKEGSRSEAKTAADAARIAEFRGALQKAETARAAMRAAAGDEEAQKREAGSVLAAAESVLLLNPSHYTMWNARKEALLVVGLSEATLPAELRLTAKCLQLNPKTYCVWEHRRYAVQPLLDAKLAEQEMALCDRFHGYDARNFHCWNYRRWVAQSIGRDEEMTYTLRRIREDFSNYSAWHARSLAVGARGEAGTEWGLVFNALYTNPQDQSLWMYVFWLLSQTDDEQQLRVLASHCEQLVELDGEAAAKWPLLALLRLRSEKALAAGSRDREALVATLLRIDPQRKGYYEHFSRVSKLCK